MKVILLPAMALIALSACTETPYVETQQGVGFSDYQSYTAAELARRADAERRAQAAAAAAARPVPVTAPPPVAPLPAAVPPPAVPPVGAIVSAPLDARTTTEPVPPPVGTTATPGISDEQDFSAVAGRETIESDAARIAANKAAYQEVQPGALPERPTGDAATIVEFALSTTNSVGESIYKRAGIMAQSRFDRNCAKYPSQDKAQEAFLAAGGPKRDSKGLDPDGDGFACFWDPAPFRSAKLGAPVAPVATDLASGQ